jgi:hypothetical protein
MTGAVLSIVISGYVIDVNAHGTYFVLSVLVGEN